MPRPVSYAIVRSVSHDDVDHGSASYLALTGQFHLRRSSNPPIRPTDFPTYGAILRRVRPSSDFPYTAVHVNGPLLTPREAGPGRHQKGPASHPPHPDPLTETVGRRPHASREIATGLTG